MEKQELVDNGFIDGKKSFEYFAKRINEDFDFEMVHKAMVAVNWYWNFGTDTNGMEIKGIPSLETIENNAFGLLKEIYNLGKGSISTGGFTAGWDSGNLYLIFTLEEASVI